MNMKTEEVGAAQIRNEKHRELNDAIEHIGSINERLCELVDRISGVDAPPNCKPESLCPCLSDVLEAGPNHIRERIDTAHNYIDRLRELLF